jgi:hypothetical protein
MTYFTTLRSSLSQAPGNFQGRLDGKSLVIDLYRFRLSLSFFINSCKQEIGVELSGLTGNKRIQGLYGVIVVTFLVQVEGKPCKHTSDHRDAVHSSFRQKPIASFKRSSHGIPDSSKTRHSLLLFAMEPMLQSARQQTMSVLNKV